jgi:hypothetical protein
MAYRIIRSEEIAYRHDFALLCNARGYRDAVEVGVDLGVFARSFLDRFEGSWLLLVDPYDRSLDAQTAIQALAPHHGRFRFIRDRSPEAIDAVLKLIRSPGFVYIDGSHDEFDVWEDIKAWYGVLSDDGMIAGHDFDDDHPGVVSAVTRFAEERGLVVRLTHEESSPRSWYCYKREPAELYQRLYLESKISNFHRPL